MTVHPIPFLADASDYDADRAYTESLGKYYRKKLYVMQKSVTSITFSRDFLTSGITKRMIATAHRPKWVGALTSGTVRLAKSLRSFHKCTIPLATRVAANISGGVHLHKFAVPLMNWTSHFTKGTSYLMKCVTQLVNRATYFDNDEFELANYATQLN